MALHLKDYLGLALALAPVIEKGLEVVGLNIPVSDTILQVASVFGVGVVATSDSVLKNDEHKK